MNREDIIRMAREVGFNVEKGYLLRITGIDEDLERFAELVAKHTLANIDPSSFMTWQEGYEAGKQTEREACAKICEEVFDTGLVMAPVAPNLAAKIRARGNTKQFEPCPFIECDCDGNHPLNQPAIRARGDKHD